MTYNINDTVNYSYNDDIREGVITEVSSDMDSYEDMQLKDGVALYWSKKMKKFTPVKVKNENTVFLTVVTGKGLQEQTNYISMNEVL
jgi:uncharacterized membrane protein YdfJ with MMPL/SSD domain